MERCDGLLLFTHSIWEGYIIGRYRLANVGEGERSIVPRWEKELKRRMGLAYIGFGRATRREEESRASRAGWRRMLPRAGWKKKKKRRENGLSR